MIKNTIKFIVLTCLAAVIPTTAPLTSYAAHTNWQSVEGGQIRLLTTPLNDDNTKKWGVTLEIELNDGWKTYWKNPGTSGVPPQFRWEKSKNLKSTPEINFPTPKLIQDSNGLIIGYKHHVAFTGEIELTDENEATSLELTALLGICSDICIPVKVEFQLDNLTGSNSVKDQIAKDAYDAGKKALPLADSPTVKILSVKQGKQHELLISTKVPTAATKLALLPVGADGWYLFPAKLIERNGDIATFTLDITDIPKDGDASKTPIEYTLIGDGTSVVSKLTITP